VLYSSPATPFVGAFVGLSNRIPATVAGGTATVLGHPIPTLPGSADAAGVALVRPEAVSVTPDAAGPATVVAVSFRGPVSQVTVEVEGTLVVAQVGSGAALALEANQRVAVTIDPAPVLVVAD
jgi:putative spermidine/putrescine transport system ATP-binding protein